MFDWWREGDAAARRAFIAASLGWMLDSFDVLLYALLIPAIMRDLSIDRTTGGWLQSLTLVASAAGGLIFGIVADRWGRARALMASVVIYSVFTAACGFASTLLALAIFRVCLGLGMGGEWASGAALVCETWPARVRGRVLGFMQSSWAIGYGLAAIVNWLVQDVGGFGWRSVFFVGVLPALFTLWVRRRVSEPQAWVEARRAAPPVPTRRTFAGSLAGLTIAVTLMNACTMFGWWGWNLWIPSYLRAPVAAGGVGLSNAAMNWFVVITQVGMWFGYVTYGYVSDHVGRKRSYVAYLLLAAGFVVAYTSTRNAAVLLALGPVVAFFGTGYFSGFGAITAELYPTAVRGRAQGFTYNVGRLASAAAPWLVGGLAETRGFPIALSTTAAAFVLAALLWLFIPETKGRALA